MSLVELYSSRVSGDRLSVLLLKHMMDGFIAEHPTVLTKTYRFYEDRESFGFVPISVVSREDWIDFNKWCQPKGVTANLKKRVIDGNKVWWPSTVEIMPDDDSNEYWVWIKLRDYY